MTEDELKPYEPGALADDPESWERWFNAPRRKKRRGRPIGTRKPPNLTSRLVTLVTPEAKAWVEAHGGGEYIRKLIEKDRSQ